MVEYKSDICLLETEAWEVFLASLAVGVGIVIWINKHGNEIEAIAGILWRRTFGKCHWEDKI